jgi:hypothetical protein
MHRFRTTVLATALLIVALVLSALCARARGSARTGAGGCRRAHRGRRRGARTGRRHRAAHHLVRRRQRRRCSARLLDRFEAENPDIKVVMDTVPYASGILETLPLQLEAGEGPDMARVTQLGVLSKYMLDLRPLSNPEYWDENFGPFLAWMQAEPGGNAIPGFMTQLTVTGPFINRTLFEQAGVPVPSDSSDQVTWQEWAEASPPGGRGDGHFAMVDGSLRPPSGRPRGEHGRPVLQR